MTITRAIRDGVEFFTIIAIASEVRTQQEQERSL